jgi:predicted RNase H-like nuclease (RuvC/YqgF family)
MNIKNGDAIIIINAAGGGPSTAKSISRIQPKFIVLCTGMSHEAEEIFIKNRIPMIKSSEIEIKYIDDMPAVLTTQIEEKLKDR